MSLVPRKGQRKAAASIEPYVPLPLPGAPSSVNVVRRAVFVIFIRNLCMMYYVLSVHTYIGMKFFLRGMLVVQSHNICFSSYVATAARFVSVHVPAIGTNQKWQLSALGAQLSEPRLDEHKIGNQCISIL